MTREEYFYSETNKHIRNVQLLINEVTEQLLSRGRLHDVTKFDDEEKSLFTQVIPEMAKTSYGSDAYKETLQKIKPAIEHHNKLNPHHPEHYAAGVRGMSLVDIVEMLCDWMASASRGPGGDVYKSIEMNQKMFGYSDELKQILINTVYFLESQTTLFEEHYRWTEE